jgi:hypothetical protein
VRLSDTLARPGGDWFVARALAAGRVNAELQWKPLTSDSVALRFVAADTTVMRLRVGADAGAGTIRRVGC